DQCAARDVRVMAFDRGFDGAGGALQDDRHGLAFIKQGLGGERGIAHAPIVRARPGIAVTVRPPRRTVPARPEPAARAPETATPPGGGVTKRCGTALTGGCRASSRPWRSPARRSVPGCHPWAA